MAGAVGAALRKKRAQGGLLKDHDGPKFYTPARFGWGRVAQELHPRQTQV